MTVTVRPVTQADHPAWDTLYQGYAEFYGVTQTPEMRDKVWSWLFDHNAQSEGLVAVTEDGTVVGITHFRPFARPLSATTGGFLDDLFVSPDARGLGAADALIAGVKAEAVKRGWSIVRWITAEDNYRARAVYDRMSNRTKWVTYDLPV